MAETKKTYEELEAEVSALKSKELKIKREELEFRELELAEKKASLQDAQERLLERGLKRENKESRARMNGLTLHQIAAGNEQKQDRCNHKKGGMDAAALVTGQGTDSQYAVLKHTFANGDMWVRCLRCGKWWKPPLEEDYMLGGKLDTVRFDAAVKEYKEALNFQTLNIPSGSVTFGFSDGGKNFRKQTKNAGN